MNIRRKLGKLILKLVRFCLKHKHKKTARALHQMLTCHKDRWIADYGYVSNDWLKSVAKDIQLFDLQSLNPHMNCVTKLLYVGQKYASPFETQQEWDVPYTVQDTPGVQCFGLVSFKQFEDPTMEFPFVENMEGAIWQFNQAGSYYYNGYYFTVN